MYGQGSALDSLQSPDAGANQHGSSIPILLACRMPACVVKGLIGSRHCEDDEIINLALFFRLHPIVGIEFALAGTSLDEAADLTGDVRHVKLGDAPRTALSRNEVGPGGFDAAPHGRNQAHARNNHPPHHTSSGASPTKLWLAR